MSYTNPKSVVSPKNRLDDLNVLFDKGQGGWSLAQFTWDGEEGCLGLRWNGDEKSAGNPQSRRPTWFVVPKELAPALRQAIKSIKAQAQSDLMAGYAGMAADTGREQEAQQSSEILLKDATE